MIFLKTLWLLFLFAQIKTQSPCDIGATYQSKTQMCVSNFGGKNFSVDGENGIESSFQYQGQGQESVPLNVYVVVQTQYTSFAFIKLTVQQREYCYIITSVDTKEYDCNDVNLKRRSENGIQTFVIGMYEDQKRLVIAARGNSVHFESCLQKHNTCVGELPQRLEKDKWDCSGNRDQSSVQCKCNDGYDPQCNVVVSELFKDFVLKIVFLSWLCLLTAILVVQGILKLKSRLNQKKNFDV